MFTRHIVLSIVLSSSLTWGKVLDERAWPRQFPGMGGNPCDTICIACALAKPLVALDGLQRIRNMIEPQSREDMCAKYGGDHDMCLPEKGSACGGASQNAIGFSASEKQAILDAHNGYRRKIAKGLEAGAHVTLPQGANMRALKWNDNLAAVAQRWADQCAFKHDKMKNRMAPSFDSVGQNIFIAMSSKDTPEVPIARAVDGWYSEVKDYSSPVNSFAFSHETGHFTQLVWGETAQVGCGYTRWLDGSDYTKMIVCDYGESGNWKGEPMYIEGKPCSKCPSGTSCDDAICA